MSENLDRLAGTAANALVSAMMTDSWEAVRHRFAYFTGPGHLGRMDAARAELIRKSGQDREEARLSQTRAWSTRLRDVLDDPRAAAGLRALLADLPEAPAAATALTSQRAHADRGSQAVTIGGSISGNTGEVYVAVGKVDKRRFRFMLIPINFFIHVTKKVAAAHPAIGATAAAAALTAVIVVAVQPAAAQPSIQLTGKWAQQTGSVYDFVETSPDSYSADPVGSNAQCQVADDIKVKGSNGRYKGSMDMYSGCRTVTGTGTITIDVAANGKTASFFTSGSGCSNCGAGTWTRISATPGTS